MVLLFALARNGFVDRGALVLENLALRQQLAAYKQAHLQRTCKRSRLRTVERIVWVWLSKLWQQSALALIIVKPQIVIGWRRQDFKLEWRRRSLPIRPGRPAIAFEHIAFIRAMSRGVGARLDHRTRSLIDPHCRLRGEHTVWHSELSHPVEDATPVPGLESLSSQ